jgi:Ca2+-binding RTX toxin-like protein
MWKKLWRSCSVLRGARTRLYPGAFDPYGVLEGLMAPLSLSTVLSFEFSDESDNTGYGEIVGHGINLDRPDGQSVFQATDGYIHFNSGAQDYIGRYYFKDLSAESSGDNWGIDDYDPFFEFPAGNNSRYAWTNKYNNSYLWEYNNPGVVFVKDGEPQAVGLWSVGERMALSLYDQLNNEWRDYELSLFRPLEIDQAAPPTLQSTAATSNQLILKFSEDIQIAGSGALNPAYMTVIVDGQTRKVTRSQITGPDHPTIHTASQLVLTLSGRSLDSAKSISVLYNPPSNTTTSGFITDLSDNPLASIATQVVDTFSTSTSINKSGIASAYKNLILTGSAPITGYGNAQNNTITGNDANNTLDGLAGADTMIGGLGDDTYVVDNVGDVITELASAGTDTVQSTIAYTLTNNLENLTLLGSWAINGTGNTANNILTGNAGVNVLNGNGGTDTLIGGRGDDIYIVDSVDDIIKETLSSNDVDSVQSSVSWVLGTNLENLTLTGSSAINGTGNQLDNNIIGNDASNIVDGGNGGTDRLTGLGDADTFLFSSRPSSFRSSSPDHITDFSNAQGDKIQINKSAFGITTSTATLSVVSNATALNTALSNASLFVYNTSNGELHWNQNGIFKGAGTGGVLAILDNKATLSAGDLVLV